MQEEIPRHCLALFGTPNCYELFGIPFLWAVFFKRLHFLHLGLLSVRKNGVAYLPLLSWIGAGVLDPSTLSLTGLVEVPAMLTMANLAVQNVYYEAIHSSACSPQGRRMSVGGESTTGRILLFRSGSVVEKGRPFTGCRQDWRQIRRTLRRSGKELSSSFLCSSCLSAARSGISANPSRFREVSVQDGEFRDSDIEDDQDSSSKEYTMARNEGEEGISENLAVDEQGQQEETWWKNFPDRYRTMVATSLAFVICNMDKVNMSVAIIPMSHQLGWNASTAGLVQSSFFWGYALSQLPGGWLAKKYSGKKVLRAGVLIWSIATAVVPTVSTFMPALFVSRLLVGLGEGVSPSAAVDLIARTMPVTERSRAVAFVFGGLNVGSIVGLLLAPQIIENYGWESVFYFFGLIGILWCFAFDRSASSNDNDKDSRKVLKTSSFLQDIGSVNNGRKESTADGVAKPHEESDDTQEEPIPWKEIFKSPAIWAMIYAHFCGNWGHYTLLSWLPTFFSEELNLDLSHAAAVAILPSLCSVVVSTTAARLADKLISKGVDTTLVRKICQTIAFLSPAACMAVTCLNPQIPPWGIVGILTAGIGLSSVALAGLYCTHQDISPKYASILLGITSTVGAIPGVLGVALVGYIFDETKSWNLALFAPSIFFYLTGAVVWNIFASSRPQSFKSAMLSEPKVD